MSDDRTGGAIRAGAAQMAAEAVGFFQELVRTPSLSGREGEVIALIRDRMTSLAFDEVRIDPFGNVLGRIGAGPRTLAFDAHVDTVGVGDRRLWSVDPFGGEIRDGVLYGRGASDQKGGMAALVYAGTLIRRLGLAEGWTIWIVGSVFEEDCDGLCWHYILSEKVIAPEAVVLTEPTGLQVCRGQRGRMEIEVTTRGLSCHGSAPERGVNAIHRMAPIVSGIAEMSAHLTDDPFLGRGSITTSQVRSTAPSLCAVADSCTIHLDRRLTAGETEASALAEIREIVDAAAAREDAAPVVIEVPVFERPTYRGFVYPMRQVFPPWVLEETHPLVQTALRARALVLGDPGVAGRWTFSTNGVATMGLHGVPTIGFGPGQEAHAHAPSDQCPVDHIETSIAFYATLASLMAAAGADAM